MQILMRLPSDLRNLITPHPTTKMELYSWLALFARIITGTAKYQEGQSCEKTGHNTRRREWKRREDRPSYNKNYKTQQVKIPLAGDQQETRNKGTCHKCGRPWSPGHTCRRNDINVIHEDELLTMGDSHSDLAYNIQEDEDDDDHSINMLEIQGQEILKSNNFKGDA